MVIRFPPRRTGGFLLEMFKGPREEARAYARGYLARYPKGGYMSAVDNWRVAEDGEIEFTMRRLESAD